MAVDTHEAPVLDEVKPIRRYRIRSGMFAWMAHRLSGVAVVLYLVIHVWGLKALTDRDAFNELIAGYHAPIFKLGEVALLAAVVYHSLNGLRIVLIDFMGWSPKQARMFWTLFVVALALIVVGGYPSIVSVINLFSAG
ncbi:MAG: succinate dehydrogenase, cytochrome b556 subunit [Bacteroidota bacterium]